MRRLLIRLLPVLVLIIAPLSGVVIGGWDGLGPPPTRVAPPRKGLAMAMSQYTEDLDALGVSWYYTWSEDCGNDSRCVPMVRSMQLPQSCPPILLVGNEPNSIEPFGAPASPRDAAFRVAAIEQQCPSTRIVALGLSSDNWVLRGGYAGPPQVYIYEFLREYHALTGRDYTQTIAVHCYTQHDANWCINQLRRMRGAYRGPMWMTEGGVLDGDVEQFAILLNYVSRRFERFAFWTNRTPSACNGARQGWESDNRMNMVDCNSGQLTPVGQYYSLQR